MFAIVPNSLKNAIDKLLGDALTSLPTPPTEEEIDSMYHAVLSYFDDHGILPKIAITKRIIDSASGPLTKEE